MTTLLKKDYQYSSVLWEEVMQRVQEIIRDEYNISPYVAPTLNRKTPSPFRIWSSAQGTETLYAGAWHKEYTISVNHYLKTEDSERFYKKLYQESERLYQLFFNNQGTQSTQTLGFFGGEPEGIQITQEGDYFRIEVLFTCQVFRADDVVYVVTAPSSIRASTRAIEKPFNFWSLYFDGTNHEINTGLEGLSVGSSFTFSAWINGDTFVSTDKTIISNGLETNHRLFSIENGKLFLRIYEGGYSGDDLIRAMASTTFSTGVWYNAVATYDGTNIKLYINGIEETTTEDGAGSTGNVSNTTTIGYLLRSTKESFFNGQMSEVSVFNSVLSSSEISAIYNDGQPILLTENQGGYKSSSNLVAYYRMGSGSGDDRDIGTKNFGLVADQLDTSVGENINNVTSYVVSDAGDESDPLHSDFPNSSTPNIEANTLYKIEMDITGSNNLGYLQLTINYSGASMENLWQADTGGANGEYREYVYSGSNAGALFIRAGGGTTWNGTASNISVKKIGGNGGILKNFDGLDFRTNVPQIYDKALFSNSLVFDGIDDYIDLSEKTTSLQSNGFTFAAWIYPHDLSNTQFLISGDSNDNNIRFNGNGYQLFVEINNKGTTIGDWSSDSDGVFVINQWQHLVVTYDNGTVTIYRNGNPVTFDTGGTTYSTDTGATEFKYRHIGKRYGVASYYDGGISDMAIYDTDLDATNVTAMYNSGKPIDLTCDAGNYNNANNLVAYWKMGDGYLDVLPTDTTAGTIMDQVTPIAGEGNIGTTVNMNASSQSTSVPE